MEPLLWILCSAPRTSTRAPTAHARGHLCGFDGETGLKTPTMRKRGRSESNKITAPQDSDSDGSDSQCSVIPPGPGVPVSGVGKDSRWAGPAAGQSARAMHETWSQMDVSRLRSAGSYMLGLNCNLFCAGGRAHGASHQAPGCHLGAGHR
jgi:hypothetical protein